MLGSRVVWAQAVIFSTKPCSKNAGLRLVSRIFEENQQSAIPTKIEQHFGGFFQQIKVRQPIGRKDSKQTETDIPTSKRLDY
jgi:hypothetical protein